MRWPTAALTLLVVLLASALVAHAEELSVDAGTLQTQVISFEFTPPANSEDDCKNKGWEYWVDADGQQFPNQGQCISYVNGGGVLYPPPDPNASNSDTPAVTTSTGSLSSTADPEVVDDATTGPLDTHAGQRCEEDGWRGRTGPHGASYESEQECIEGEQAAYRERAGESSGGAG